MNNANETPNIVDISQRQDPRNERVGDLMAAVRDVATTALQRLLSGMFENVDDALFDIAEKAENNAIQTQYFDGMREVRKKRALVERSLIEQVSRKLTDLASGRISSGKPETTTSMFGDSELSLVDDTELEESLAITSMISKTESRLARPLFAANQRLSVICGGNKLDNANNPLAPAFLAYAFRRSMRQLGVEMRVKLIIFKLFDRYVMNGLDALYDSINIELMRAGVLPQLRHASSNRQKTAGSAQGQDAAAGAGGAQADDDADIRAKLLDTLNSLLAQRRTRGSYGGWGGNVSGPSLSPAELLGALTLLQSSHVQAEEDEAAADYQLIDIEVLKQQLMQQISRLKGGQGARVSGADEDTIDLVAMLFEFIHQDRNLPAEMQALLSRLQIPYLKAAILDRRMFAHTQHPARQLLDTLADVAKGWSAESDRDHRVYDKLKSVVDTLLQDFDDDTGVFERLLTDLQNFIESHRKRAELSEQRLAEATRGREKLQEARRRAAREILSRIDHRELPSLAHSILTRAWANYMVLTLLRQGEESQEFRNALHFVDDFIWSTCPIHGDADCTRLRQLLPQLEKSLRHGLATVAFQDADVENLMRQLNAFYRQQLGETVTASEDDASTQAAPPMPATVEAFVTPEIASEEEAAPEAVQEVSASEPEVEDEHVRIVKSFKVGTWVEFLGEGGSSERAKLSWISPISGKYLFVNRRGLKVADKSVTQLAEELRQGDTVVLEELPLFDRALDAIVERLRQNAPATPADAPPATP